MTSTPYKPISWNSPEPAFVDKLNAMCNNAQWIYENAPRIYYSVNGVKRSSGIKVASGHLLLNSSSGRYAASTQSFGDYFSQGCQPVVVVGEMLSYPMREVIATIRGMGTTWPDNRGFELYLTATGEATKVANTVYAPWIAVGY